jgi:RimJ/RimL family protein N-acetyltransferase
MPVRAFLRTARLTLRPLAPEDAAPLTGAVNDYAVAKWLTTVPHPYTLEDAREFIERIAPKAGHIWVIEDTDGLQGLISIGKELGYWLAARAWGRGYMTEAAAAVVAEWFANPRNGLLRSSHFEGNLASAAVLTRLGFVATGPCTLPALARGEDVPAVKMLLTRAGWRAATAGGVKT